MNVSWIIPSPGASLGSYRIVGLGPERQSIRTELNPQRELTRRNEFVTGFTIENLVAQVPRVSGKTGSATLDKSVSG